MTYQPFLPEAAAGNISPRHAVVPLRRELRKLPGARRRGHPVEHAPQDRDRAADRRPGPGDRRTTTSSWRPARSPGPCRSRACASTAIGFKTIGEAIYLRNHVLDRLDVAATTADPAIRQRGADLRLRRRRVRRHRGAGRDGGHGPRRAALLPGARSRRTCAGCWSRRPSGCCPRSTGTWAPTPSQQLLKRGHGHPARHPAGVLCGRCRASSPTATASAADTIVWTAGVKPSPMLDSTDLPRDAEGRVTCLPTLQVVDGDRVRRGRLERRRLRRRAGPDQASRVRCARRAPSTRCARPRGWPTTSRP